MPRLSTVAAVLGVLSGGWLLAGVSLGVLKPGGCSPGSVSCFTSTFPQLPAQGAALLVVVVSLASLVGPKKIFYLLAGLCVILAGLVLLSSDVNLNLYLTVGLLAVAAAVSLFAGAHESSVSEQSNPMNLPVFG